MVQNDVTEADNGTCFSDFDLEMLRKLADKQPVGEKTALLVLRRCNQTLQAVEQRFNDSRMAWWDARHAFLSH